MNKLRIIVGVFVCCQMNSTCCLAQVAARAETSDSAVIATVERTRHALELAKLAAENGFEELSMRAVRDTLAAGPPIKPVQLNVSTTAISTTNPNQNPEHQQINEFVYSQLYELSEIWSNQGFDAAAAYRTLSDVVLPRARPTEVFLYQKKLVATGSTENSKLTPENIGQLLVAAARRADATDDLREKILARADQLRSRVPARVLLTQLALVEQDSAEANRQLRELEKAVTETPTQFAAELACHVALPALSSNETKQAAVPLVERGIDRFQDTQNLVNYQIEPASSLLLAVARARLEGGEVEFAKKHIQRFLDVNQSYNNRRSGDYGLHLRKRQLETAANELVRAGAIADAIGLLGEHADIQTRYDGNSSGGQLGARLAQGLTAQTADVQYKLLRDWCMPRKGRKSIRLLSVFVPRTRPPQVFAGLLPADQRDTAFEIKTFGPLKNFVSTGPMLITAAKELDQLDALTDELEQLRQQKVENADAYHRLALVIAGRDADAIPDIEKLAAEFDDNKQVDRKRIVSLKDYAVALACIERPQLRGLGERIMRRLVEHGKRLQLSDIRGRAWAAFAEAVRHRADGVSDDLLTRPILKHWVPAAYHTPRTHAAGPTANTWVGQEGIIDSISSPYDTHLFFKYPLSGTFQVSTEMSDSGWREGGLAYDGLTWRAQGYRNESSVAAVGRTGSQKRIAAVMRGEGYFNPSTLQITPDRVRFLINRHLVMEESVGSASPWLGVKASSGYTTSYRNLRITGNPVIPRQVRLIEDRRMRGWITSLFGDSAPDVLDSSDAKAQISTANAVYDWDFADGVLNGRKSGSSLGEAVQSRIYYQRPLLTGESYSYEFFYEPGKTMTHPCVGRMAFLLRRDGVLLHWITDGQMEWTELPADNEIADAESRRGPAQLPLQAGEWNQMVVSLEGDLVRLELNGVAICERQLIPDNTRLFGFFHYKNRETVKVRDVVLQGDWPESIDDIRDNLLEHDGPTKTADRYVIHAIQDEEHISRMAWHVFQKSRTLIPEERYGYLLDWVLPNDTHPTTRLRGDFLPTRSSPPVAKLLSLNELGTDPGGLRGGPVVAPALELVALARELGRLDEFRKRVEGSARLKDNPDEERARIALMAIVELADGSFDAANRHIDELKKRLPSMSTGAEYLRWPELIAAWVGIHHAETRDNATMVLEYIVRKQINARKSGGWRFDGKVRSLYGLASHLQKSDGDLAGFATSPPLMNWVAAEHEKGDINGIGIPNAHWTRIPSGVVHQAGNERDYLYYRIPLRGNFQIDCRLTGFGHRESRVLYADKWLGVNWRKNEYDYGRVGQRNPNRKFDPPVKLVNTWYNYRLRVQDGVYSAWVEGQKIHEETLPPNPDPWLALRCESSVRGGFANLRITGDPVIPVELKLSDHTDLSGWMPHLYRQSFGDANDDWSMQNKVIVGRLRPEFEDTAKEGMLQYHRPIVEDTELSYEFMYEPNSAHVHPALDRLVFLLDPNGVRIHWATDGAWDRSQLAPDNAYDEPENQLHKGPLPLLPGKYNKMQLTIVGEVVTLVLNDQPIFRRKLNAGNRRLFGLFHYVGETTARVRNTVYRGDWPKSLPKVEEQQLASIGKSFTEVDNEKLKDVLEHDFSIDGIPDNLFFRRNDPQQQVVTSTDQGLKVHRPGEKPWTESGVGCRVGLVGDFDVTVSFEQLKLDVPKKGSSLITLLCQFAGPQKVKDFVRTGVGRRKDGSPYVGQVYGRSGIDADRKYFYGSRDWNPEAGKLRLVRQGPNVYFLFADGESDDWQLVEFASVGRADVTLNQIALQAVAGGTGESTHVVWKKLTIRAEEIFTKPRVKKRLISELDRHKSQLKARYQHDFQTDGLPTDRFVVVGNKDVVSSTENGVRVVEPGADVWKRTAIASTLRLRGDFDITAGLEIKKLEAPSTAHSGAYLYINFDNKKTETTGIHRVFHAVNGKIVLGSHAVVGEKGKRLHTPMKQAPLDSIGRLRVVRRGSTVYLLFARKGAQEFELLDQKIIGTDDVRPRGVQLTTHTSGNGRETEVVWNRLEISAKEIIPREQ